MSKEQLRQHRLNPTRSKKLASQLQIVDLKGGVRRQIRYAELEKDDQQKVLADLLVKSAINHALEKQRKVNLIFNFLFSFC